MSQSVKLCEPPVEAQSQQVIVSVQGSDMLLCLNCRIKSKKLRDSFTFMAQNHKELSSKHTMGYR